MTADESGKSKRGEIVTALNSCTETCTDGEKGHAIAERLQSDFPAIRMLEVKRSADVLQAVATGEADAYVGNLTVGSYLVREQQLDNLMVVAPTPFGNHSNAMAVREESECLHQ